MSWGERPGRGQLPILHEALDELIDRLPLFIAARQGKTPTHKQCVGTKQNPSPWAWKCDGYCNFTHQCRRRALKEERKKSEGFTRGVEEGRAGIIQQMKTAEGAAEFVLTELNEQARRNLAAALEKKG